MKENKNHSSDRTWEILLVNDEPEYLNIAKTILEKKGKGLKVETTDSAKKGLQLLKNKKFDAVISDYKMPWITGIEFFKKLKELEDEIPFTEGEIPFIILTGRGSEEVAREAANVGVDLYVKKGEKTKKLFEKLADKLIQTIEEKKKSRSDRFIAWIETKSYTDRSLAKYDLKELAEKTGFKTKKIEAHESPFNPKSADVIKTYTESFEKIPKSKSEEASEWRKRVMEDMGNLDADVIIKGKENTEKTQFLKKIEKRKWEEFDIKELKV